jgi:hypothetical protein
MDFEFSEFVFKYHWLVLVAGIATWVLGGAFTYGALNEWLGPSASEAESVGAVFATIHWPVAVPLILMYQFGRRAFEDVRLLWLTSSRTNDDSDCNIQPEKKP